MTTEYVRRLIREAKERALNVARSDRERAPEKLIPALTHIANHLFDPRFTIGTLKKLGLAREGREWLKNEFGMTPVQYANHLKAVAGKWLLSNSLLPLKEIGSALGYKLGTEHNFGRDLERWTGQKIECFRPESQGRLEDPLTDLQWGEIENSLAIYRPDLLPKDAECLSHRVWNVLLEESSENRTALLANEVLSGHTELFEVLLAEAKAYGNKNRLWGVELMRLPLAFAKGSAALLGTQAPRLRVRAHAWLANAHRLAGNFAAAEAEMVAGEEYWSTFCRESILEGELALFWGSLRISQRRFGESRRLLTKAVEISRKNFDCTVEIQSRIQRAAISVYEGNPQGAILDLETVHERIVKSEEPENRRRLLDVVHNLVVTCAEAGYIQQGKAHLSEAEKLTEEHDYGPGRHKLSWYRGVLFFAEDAPIVAEKEFRKARAGFLNLRDPLLTALVTLDLAILCHEQGRHREAISLLKTDVLPVFKGLQLDCEELAAGRLLAQAVAERSVSIRILEDLRRFLRIACRI